MISIAVSIIVPAVFALLVGFIWGYDRKDARLRDRGYAKPMLAQCYRCYVAKPERDFWCEPGGMYGSTRTLSSWCHNCRGNIGK